MDGPAALTNLEPCPKHEMIGCQVCAPRPAPEPEPDSRPFRARYDGDCPACGMSITAERDWIVMRVRGSFSQALHEECA